MIVQIPDTTKNDCLTTSVIISGGKNCTLSGAKPVAASTVANDAWVDGSRKRAIIKLTIINTP